MHVPASRELIVDGELNEIEIVVEDSVLSVSNCRQIQDAVITFGDCCHSQ